MPLTGDSKEENGYAVMSDKTIITFLFGRPEGP